MRTILFLCIIICASSQDKSFPATEWLYYKDISESGFLPDSIKAIQIDLKKSQTAAFLIIHRGRIVSSYGEVTRHFRNSSMRKSFLHLLLGIAYDKRELDLNASLADLNIDDIDPLSAKEKRATVSDLLRSDSHIFHMSAHMPQGMRERIPERFSEPKGWFYNNWDFNTLGGIYQQVTGDDIFAAFSRQVAAPLQFEDFDTSQTYYRREPDLSNYPAYLFRLSARDMARIGLLYLNKGNWNGKQIVSEDWIKISFKTYVTDMGVFSDRGSYGYLWWIYNDPEIGPLYYASGNGGQRLFVIPDQEMVIVHSVNTYENKRVYDQEIFNLVRRTVKARTMEAVLKPKLEEFRPPVRSYSNKVDPVSIDLKSYMGLYQHRALGTFRIFTDKKQLKMETNVGIFNLYSETADTFIPEDILTPIHFKKAGKGDKKNTVIPQFSSNRDLLSVTFYY